MKKPKAPPRALLTIVFAVMVFIVLTITMVIVGFIAFFLVQTDLIAKSAVMNTRFPVFMLAVASILVGTLVAAILSRIPIKPLDTLIKGMDQLASGDYVVRIDLGNFSIVERLSQSFNTLASELEKTELLRSDFVNNFSHEFKTPIVSIRGFAKLLQKGNLSEQQNQDYLEIIVDESTRLADMATNVLNLTKVENQQILTDLTSYNFAEQIRNSVLLLEKKWVEKKLTIVADFAEHWIVANEEMLMQVWVNLLDNAIKFSDFGDTVEVAISSEAEDFVVAIKNHGPMIDPQIQGRLFDKFWQGDASRAIEGTGIGLSIARRIVDLHQGEITVESSQAETVFFVRLPQMGLDSV